MMMPSTPDRAEGKGAAVARGTSWVPFVRVNSGPSEWKARGDTVDVVMRVRGTPFAFVNLGLHSVGVPGRGKGDVHGIPPGGFAPSDIRPAPVFPWPSALGATGSTGTVPDVAADATGTLLSGQQVGGTWEVLPVCSGGESRRNPFGKGVSPLPQASCPAPNVTKVGGVMRDGSGVVVRVTAYIPSRYARP